MLVVVRKDQPKIAMGLLSYLPRLHDVASVQREIEWYQADDCRDILLWQSPITQHYVAVVGIEKIFDSAVLRLVVFGPEVADNERNQVGAEIYEALQMRYADKVLVGTIATQPILTEWRKLANG
ncbi:reductase [Weissella sp. MSCH1]|uniref:reductase n=1 Tax=Weissella sp. MSCH1 TaxID=3383343 RepID=UPI003896D41B